MANIKISDLTALTPPDAADLVPVTDKSATQTKRTTVGEIVGIVNGDVDVADDGTATISELPVSKLKDGDARQLLQTDAAGTGVEWTSNVDVPGTLDVTGAASFDSTGRFIGDVTLDSTLIFEGSTADGFETTLTVVDPTADRTITLPDVTGTVITTGDTGTVTSTIIADGTIVNADVNASAAIAGTKIDPDFGSQTVETTGLINAGSGTEAAPAVTVGTTDNGLYSPGTDEVALATDGTGRLFIDSNGNVGIGTSSVTGTNTQLEVAGGTATELKIGSLGANNANFRGLRFGITGDSNNYSGILFKPSTAELRLEAGYSGFGGFQTFYTDGTERLRITSTGQLSHIGGGSDISPAVGFNGSAPSNSLVIDSTGKVGAGTSSPTSALTIGAASTANPAADVTVNSSTIDQYRLKLTSNNFNADTKWLGIGFGYSDNYLKAGILAEAKDGNARTNLHFCLDGNANSDNADLGDSKMVITYGGNVGINVTSPSSLLHLADAGDITVGTTTGTKIGTATSQKIGFYNATPVVQPTAVADITTTATSGSLPTPDGSVTIADATTPTVTELLEYCVELEAKLEAALGHLRTLGLIAT